MTYVVKIDGYGIDTGDFEFEDYQEYCNIFVSNDINEIEKYKEDHPRKSNENLDEFEVEDFVDVIDCMINDNGIYPDNMHEIFTELGILLAK